MAKKTPDEFAQEMADRTKEPHLVLLNRYHGERVWISRRGWEKNRRKAFVDYDIVKTCLPGVQP